MEKMNIETIREIANNLMKAMEIKKEQTTILLNYELEQMERTGKSTMTNRLQLVKDFEREYKNFCGMLNMLYITCNEGNYMENMNELYEKQEVVRNMKNDLEKYL